MQIPTECNNPNCPNPESCRARREAMALYVEPLKLIVWDEEGKMRPEHVKSFKEFIKTSAEMMGMVVVDAQGMVDEFYAQQMPKH